VSQRGANCGYMKGTTIMRRTDCLALVFIALTLGACSEESGPSAGTLELTAHTTGRNLDPDGYSVAVDGAGATSLPTNGTASVSGLVAENRVVTLTGISENCQVQDSLPVAITIVGDVPTHADVEIVCEFANSLAYVQGSDLYITSIETGAVPERVAGNLGLPSWSPDGATLAVVSGLLPSGIVLVDAVGGNPRSVTPDVATTEIFGKIGVVA
jgi:hypothetical protein